MPFATFTRVREVSSEDDVHLAENLIKCQAGKKWKTKNVGDKSAYVILEMSDCYQITGIDIGNEHSAFVEVLVGKYATAPKDFKEILITCSFMTPIESKNSTNANRVRCFNRDALVPTAAEEKWSLVKILCTQPFNKHVPYGLSFIKIHINDSAKNSTPTQNLISQQVLNKTAEGSGKLKFREESPDSEVENTSSLFNRWKKAKQSVDEETTAISIRMASKNPVTFESPRFRDDEKPRSSTPKTNEKILDRNRKKLLFGDENDDVCNQNPKKLERLSEQIEADKKRRRVEKEKETNKKARNSLDCSPQSVVELPTKPSNSKTLAENNRRVNKASENVKTQLSLSQEKIESKKTRPLNQLLKDVVLVISGIQNPDRGDLRNKALALGAKYKADWDTTCTHLICAFKNTPKYNQVRGKGKIVTRSWIEKCYSLKKYLPWRRYALDSKELCQPESDEEIFCATENAQDEESDHSIDLLNNRRRESEDKRFTLSLYDNDERSNTNDLESDTDTDDEIERIEKNKMSESNDTNLENNLNSDANAEITRIEKGSKAVKRNSTSKIVDIYEASTDEEDYIIEKLSTRGNDGRRAA